MRIPHDSWRLAQTVIRRYRENLRLLTEWEMEVLDANLKAKDPTAHKAMLLQSGYAQRLQREISAVENMMDRLSPNEQKVIRMRFWSSRSVVPYEYMLACNYSTRQMQRIVCTAIKIVAVNLGELNPKRWTI